MLRGSILLSTVAALALVPSRTVPAIERIDARAGCASNPALVGPCFTVTGRALYANGTPGFRILRSGTKRILGVLPFENEIAPSCLSKAVTPTSEVTGDFVVCPFSVEEEGHMQMVCVQSVGEFRVRRWSAEKKTYVTSGPTPGCAL
jgi:hypothetical protein